MQKPTLDISVKLVTAVPNNVVITDNTNYTSLGLDSAEVKMTVQIFTPIGLLYSPSYYNTPADEWDLTPASPFEYADTTDALQNFLLDNKGCFLEGEYKVTMKWYYGDTEETFDYVFETTVNPTLPKIEIKQFADCFCPKFRSTDITSYGSSVEVDYEHIINYPAEADEADINTTLKDYTDYRLANGTYVSEISTTREFSVDNFILQTLLKGKKSFVVDCDTVCDIKCGINSLFDKYKAACGKDKKEADRLLLLLQKATILYTLIYFNNSCGDNSSSTSYLAQLKAILGDCDCGCSDCDSDIWVSGACGSSGGSEFDPTEIYDYINTLNTQLTNSISSINDTLELLQLAIATLQNASWFVGLDTDCLDAFPTSGTETEKRQYILDAICDLQEALDLPPIARNDTDTIVENTSVTRLLTANDFFQTDAEITITTPPSNGTAVVLGDDKTATYTPDTDFVGTDTVGYTLTDSHGNTSTAVWTIIVNATPSADCYVVVPAYNASLYSVGANLQIAIANQTAYGTNTPTSESYLIEIRNSSNSILYSYTVTGSVSADPTIWTSPIPIASNWDNVRIVLTTASNSSTGGSCGTVTYESDSPYSLNDISVSWFDGTIPPDCLDFIDGDDEIEKKQKLMDKICDNATDIATLGDEVAALPTTIGYEYEDISDSISFGAKFTDAGTIVRKYTDGWVYIYFNAEYSSNLVKVTDLLISGLPPALVGAGIYSALDGNNDVAFVRIVTIVGTAIYVASDVTVSGLPPDTLSGVIYYKRQTP